MTAYLSIAVSIAAANGHVLQRRLGPPNVVRSAPATGATGVPVTLGRITITFDREMDTGSWTIAALAGTRLPPMPRDAARWQDARTFVLAVERLEPNTRYGLTLNGSRRKGFRSKQGKPLPGATLAFTTTGAAAPAAVKIVNVVDDFIAYYDRSRDLSAHERVALWNTMLEQKHAVLFRDGLYRGKKGDDRDRFKRGFIDWFWNDVPAKMPGIRRLNEGIAARVTGVVDRFKKHFPDFRPSTDFYVTVAYSFRGKVMGVGGKDVFALGLEGIEPDGPQLDITIAHELFHLYHFQWFSSSGALYRDLWAEGLASYASDIVVPGHRMSTILGFSVEKMNRCHALLPRMARELKQHMGGRDGRIRRIYFGAEANDTDIPPEAGYYVGYLIVDRLVRRHKLADLAKMKADPVRKMLERELTALATAR